MMAKGPASERMNRQDGGDEGLWDQMHASAMISLYLPICIHVRSCSEMESDGTRCLHQP